MNKPAILYQKLNIPEPFLSHTPAADGLTAQAWGGDIRIGDLTGDGQVDFVVYKSLAGIKPCFIGAFDLVGQQLWSFGVKDLETMETGTSNKLRATSPGRPGPVVIYDIDQDGKSEVICLFADTDLLSGNTATDPWDMSQMELLILEGQTGEIKHRAKPEVLEQCDAYIDGELHLSNYIHHRLMVANFSGNPQAQDFVVKLGNHILAFNYRLELLWQYESHWYTYSKHAAYIPAVGDLDGDGLDEVNGGHFGLDNDGTPLWEKDLGLHLDAVLINQWGDQPAAIMSGGGQVLNRNGQHLLKLGHEAVPHGQEVRCGKLCADIEGQQLVIRYNGHHPDLLVADYRGQILSRFQADESPNNTGLEIIRWDDRGTDLIYSPTALYDGTGQKVVTFPDLPPPSGGKMGWYHCFPANVCGDGKEEVILYDPYHHTIFIYTADRAESTNDQHFSGYQHTPRQYNARLID